MPLKKQEFNEDEIAIYDEAIIYKRGDYWHFRMWLAGEGKYARKSLKTRSKSTAIDKGKAAYLELYANAQAGKKYFSLTTKEAVTKYLDSRKKDVEAGIIVSGRWSTIKTHLGHWLEFIGRDTKIKELDRNDCEQYYHSRIKKNRKASPASPTTIANEQSTINAMMQWLFKNNEAVIGGFEFKKLPRVDKKNNTIRRSTFTQSEIDSIGLAIAQYWHKENNAIDEREWISRRLVCYYFLIASVTGLRTGEQRQLKWGDIYTLKRSDLDVDLVNIRVRAETSKVRQSREFMIRDNGYFDELYELLSPLHENKSITNYLVFSLDGKNPITERALLYHFRKIMKIADIVDYENRNIVPYSFRHYFITQKLVHGLTHRQVADMCGTSITQIEKTYYHVDEEIKVETAMADHGMDNDGIVLHENNEERR